MLIATFGTSTGWVGKRITFENEQFILEGHGLITAADVLTYDRQGHLAWAYAGLQEWVQKVAAPSVAVAPRIQPSVAQPAERVVVSPQVEARAAPAHRPTLSFGGRGAESATISARGSIVGLCPGGTAVAASSRNVGGRNDVSSLSGLVAVSAGTYHTVGLRADGTAVAVGRNDVGECDVSSWRDLVAVSAAYYFTVGLRSDGTVVAVGRGCGDEWDFSSMKDVIAISTGDYHTVGLRSDGTAVSVGGTGDYHLDDSVCDVSSWRDLVAISAGTDRTVALRADGTAVAQGVTKHVADKIGSWNGLIAVSSGSRVTMGLRSDGTAVVVGLDRYAAAEVASWSDLVAISAGGYIVGLRADGRVLVLGGTEVGKSDLSTWVLAVPQSDEARVWVGADLRTLDAVLECPALPTEQVEAAPALDHDVPTLTRALTSGEKSPERIAAAKALGKLGDPRAVDPLGMALADESKGVHAAAANALAKIGGSRAIELLAAALRWEWNSDAPIDADALRKIGNPAVESLIAALDEGKGGRCCARRPAAQALGWIGDPRAVESLVAALRDEDSFVRIAAAEALAAIGDPRAVEPLAAALKDKNSMVSQAVASALITVGDDRAVGSLIAALDEDYVPAEVMFALGAIGNPRAVEPLAAALKSEDTWVRRAAAQALEQIGDFRAVESLIAALQVKDDAVTTREAIIKALTKIDDPRAAEPPARAREAEGRRRRDLSS